MYLRTVYLFRHHTKGVLEMKKKTLLALVLSLIVMGLAACGSTPDSQKTETTGEDSAQSDKIQDTPAKPETPEETDNGDLGAYHVAIKEAAFGKDYENKSMIVVDYDFTNNSDSDTAALYAINMKAFQNGIQLETAIVMDNKVYDAGVAQKEIKPGVTLEKCQSAFVLSDNSPVTVEMTEIFSFDDKKLVKTFTVE